MRAKSAERARETPHFGGGGGLVLRGRAMIRSLAMLRSTRRKGESLSSAGITETRSSEQA